MTDTPSIASLQKSLDELRVFVARRFDEVSFEVNATGQMVGMSEEAMTARFGEILAVLGAISFTGDGKTPHNVGVELNAVVKTTEDAANKILDAASLISRLTKKQIDWTDEVARTAFLKNIDRHADDILAACAFQDLTGQRIARTLDNIRKAESELADTLQRMGIKVDAASAAAALLGDKNQQAQSQSDIDALFA